MSEKKMVTRSVAIALGIICVVVVAGLVGAFVYDVTVMNSRIADRDNTILQLKTQITTLHSQIYDLNATVNLFKITEVATIILDNRTTSWEGSLSADYAGYVSVFIVSKDSWNASVELSYMANDESYDRIVHPSNILDIYPNPLWFPVLPALIHYQVNNSSPFGTIFVYVGYHY